MSATDPEHAGDWYANMRDDEPADAVPVAGAVGACVLNGCQNAEWSRVAHEALASRDRLIAQSRINDEREIAYVATIGRLTAERDELAAENEDLRQELTEARFDASTARGECDMAIAAATAALRQGNEDLHRRLGDEREAKAYLELDLDGLRGQLREARQEVERLTDSRAIARLERDWLLSAWAAACGVPQERAEADLLSWTAKWRASALNPSTPPEATGHESS